MPTTPPWLSGVFGPMDAEAEGEGMGPGAMPQRPDLLAVSAGGMPEDEFLALGEQDIDDLFADMDDAGVAWGADDPMEHDANLARFIRRGDLDRLAESVIRWVELDRASRATWEQREARGITKLGLTERDLQEVRSAIPGTEWRSDATHPGLLKACTQFWARSYTELWQPGGPAKAVVLGHTTPELEQQAERVASYLNYLYQHDMPAAAKDLSAALFRLPLSGSVFRKADFDPVLGQLTVRFLEGQDFVKPYSAVDLRSATRYTHIVRLSRNDLNRSVALGYYLNIAPGEPDAESAQHTLLDAAIDQATGQTPMPQEGEHQAEYDNRDILYEMSVTLDLGDYGWFDPAVDEAVDPLTGESLSVGAPYRVTVHHQEQRVLSIRRDWRETDPRRMRRRSVVEYQFLPGFGGYGFGLLHIAGGLSDAQTGLLRYALDGCTLDTAGKLSGWVSQNAVGRNGMPSLKLGEFQSVPGSVDDWKKALMTPDFQWRANNTLKTIQYLDNLLDVLVAATETMIGDSNKNMPVGTILARIEQSSKPFVAIFGLLHAAFADELRAVAELAHDYLPQRYPYAVPGADQEVFAADFDDRVDVMPVSDPNVVSGTQRLAQAQLIMEQSSALYTLAPTPETWTCVLEAYRHLLETLRVANPEVFVPAQPQPQPPMEQQGADPVQADVVRKDALAQAEIQRKAAETRAIQRKADQMRLDSGGRAAGDRAIMATQQKGEIDKAAQEILRLAEARERQMAEAVAPDSLAGVGAA